MMSRVEAKNAHEDAEGCIRKIVLLQGELAVEHQAWGCLRGSVENNSRSSPFYRLEGLSCLTLSSLPHG
jgi:hypothetical protein